MMVSSVARRETVSCLNVAVPSGALEKDDETTQNFHQKIQNETIKLVQWKAFMETALNDKERELDKAQKTITFLRSNLIDQQFEAEKFSHKLLNEQKYKKEIEIRMANTRYQCSVISNDIKIMKDALSKTKSIREHMSSASKSLQSDTKNMSESFEEIATERKNEWQQFQIEVAECTSVLAAENRALKGKVLLFEKDVSTYKATLLELEEANKKFYELQKISINTQQQNKILQDDVKRLTLSYSVEKKQNDELIDSFQKERSSLKENLQDIENRLATSRAEFEEMAGKLCYIKKQNELLEGSKQELMERLEIITSQKEQMRKDFENQVAVVSHDLTAIHAKEDDYLNDIESLKKVLTNERKTVEKYKEQVLSLKEEMEGLAKTLNSSEKSRKCLEKEFKEKLTNRQANIKKLKSSEKKYLKEINQIKKREENLKRTIQELQENEKAKDILFADLEKHLTEQITKLETAESDKRRVITESDSKIKEMLNMLDQFDQDKSEMIKAKDIEIDTLHQKLSEKESSMQCQIKEKEKETKKYEEVAAEKNDLQRQLDDMKAEFESKVKLLDKLEESIKVKSPHQSITNNPPLRTPSPSEYMSLYKTLSSMKSSLSMHDTSLESVINSPFSIEPSVRQDSNKLLPGKQDFKKKPLLNSSTFQDNNKKIGILKGSNAYVIHEGEKKHVVFNSPLANQADDYSSSDALELGSDMEDKFDYLKRSVSKRHLGSIPKARVTPTVSSVINKRNKENHSGVKKAKVDSTQVVRTYTSPKFIASRVNQETASFDSKDLSFSSVLEYTDLPHSKSF